MGERHAADEARLQHAQAALRPDRAIRKGQPDRVDPLLAPAAEAAGDEDADQRPRQKDQHVPAVDGESGVVRGGSEMARRQGRRPPRRVGDDRRNLPLALGVAEQRQRRQEHGAGQQEVPDPRIEGLQREPEMDPDAAVNPDDQQQDRLEDPGGRRGAELVELLRVALVGAEQAEGDPRAEHVVGEQERDRQAEDELRRLEASPAELPPLVERPEAEAHVGQQARRREGARRGGTARSASGPRDPAPSPRPKRCRAHD